MAEKKKYNSILISGRKDQTLTYSKYVKDEESGESVKESLDKKVNITDELTTQQIKDGAITNEKMAADSVGNTNLQDGSVSNEKLEDGSITNGKLAENSITKDKLKDNTIGVEKLDPELRQTINAATGLPENLVETIQNVDDTLKDHQSQLDDKQSQIDDKQQQITANDEDISLLQTRSTQMEETIKGIAATGGASQATAVTYNNANSQLTATNIQSAVDELQGSKIDKSSIVQEAGDAENKVMSQKAVSTKLSDLNKTLSRTNRVQLYIPDGGDSYLEESTSNVYFRFSMIVVRGIPARTLGFDELATELGVETVTSPKGIENCIILEDGKDLVFDLNDNKFKIIGRTNIDANHIILLASVSGKFDIKSSNLLDRWIVKTLSETKKQLSDLQDKLSEVSQPYKFTNNGIFMSVNGTNNVTLNDDGSITINKNGFNLYLNGKKYEIVGNTDKNLKYIYTSGQSSSYHYIDPSKLKNGVTNWDEVTDLFSNSAFVQPMPLLTAWYGTDPYPQPVGLLASGVARLLGSKALDANISKKDSDTINICNAAHNSDFKCIFFTDTHGSSDNVKKMIDNANKLGESYIDCLINGGDTVNRFNSEGLDWYDKLVKDSKQPVFNCVGNHDAWGTDYYNWDTNKNIYDLITAKVKENVPAIVQPNDVSSTFSNYYYWDKGKVRIIVICSMQLGESNDYYYDNVQNTWLESVLNDAKNNNKAVIIVNHCPFAPTDCKEVKSDWSSEYTWTNDMQDTMHMTDKIPTLVDSFIDNGGIFICYLTGHSHVDYLMTSVKHPRQFCFTSTSNAYNNHGADAKNDMDKNSYYSQAYNYIGIDLTHSVIKVQRIGLNTNAWMQEHNSFCWDFKNHKLVSSN